MSWPEDLLGALVRSPDFHLELGDIGREETGNPYYAWLAIRICIEHHKAFPDWVIDYLRQRSGRIVIPEWKTQEDLRKILPWVFCFSDAREFTGRKRGPGNLLNPDLGGSAYRRLLFPFRFTEINFTLGFAMRVLKGEKPAQAMRNACNDAFDKETADKIDDKTLKRRLLNDFSLKRWPADAAEWETILRQYRDHLIGTLLKHYQRTKSRETLG
jgi:hypothetical protein